MKDSVGYSSYTGGRSQMRLRPQQEKFDFRLRIVTVPGAAEEARKNGIETEENRDKSRDCDIFLTCDYVRCP